MSESQNELKLGGCVRISAEFLAGHEEFLGPNLSNNKSLVGEVRIIDRGDQSYGILFPNFKHLVWVKEDWIEPVQKEELVRIKLQRMDALYREIEALAKEIEDESI